MKKKLQKLILLFSLILNGIELNAQIECFEPKPEEEQSFTMLFSSRYINLYNRDTITTLDGITILYSCHTCDLRAINNNNKEIWNIDLSEFGCPINLLGYFPRDSINEWNEIFHSKSPIGKASRNGFEIIVKSKNQDFYGVKPKNGKIRIISKNEKT